MKAMHSRGMRPTIGVAAFCAAVFIGGSALAQVPSGSATDDLIAEVPDALTAAVAIRAKLNQVIDDWVAANDDRVKTYQRECGIPGPLISNGPKTKACTDRLAEYLASERTAAAAGGGSGGGHGGAGGGGAGGGHGGAGGSGGGADVCEGDVPPPQVQQWSKEVCPPRTMGVIREMGGGEYLDCGNGQEWYEIHREDVDATYNTVQRGGTQVRVVDVPQHCEFQLRAVHQPQEPLPFPEIPPLPEAGFWQEYGWLVTTVAVLAAGGALGGYLVWRDSGVTVLQPGNPPAGGGR